MSFLSIFDVAQVEAKSDRSKIDETTLPRTRDSKCNVREDVSLRSTSIMAPARTESNANRKRRANNFRVSYAREFSNAYFISPCRSKRFYRVAVAFRNNNAHYVIKQPKIFRISETRFVISESKLLFSFSFGNSGFFASDVEQGKACRKVVQSFHEN